jgi:hypothetical protein
VNPRESFSASSIGCGGTPAGPLADCGNPGGCGGFAETSKRIEQFDELVADGRMPTPVKIDGRKVWDLRALDLAFDALVSESSSPNSWDGVAMRGSP